MLDSHSGHRGFEAAADAEHGEPGVEARTLVIERPAGGWRLATPVTNASLGTTSPILAVGAAARVGSERV